MDEFTKKQIKECESNINGIQDLIKIEKDKPKPNLVQLKKWETMLAQQQGILNGLKGTKLN